MAEGNVPNSSAGNGANGPGGERTEEDRLEAALERIAKVLEAPDPVAIEVAERLDRMIASLRTALAKQ